MRILTTFFLATMLLVVNVSPAQADLINVRLAGSANEDNENPLEVFFDLFVGANAGTGFQTPSSAEYPLSPDDPDAANFGKVVQAQITPAGASGLVGSSFSVPAAFNAAAEPDPFGSILINIQNDVTLENGTFIGDAVSFGFFDGTLMVDGNLIQQVTVNLLDRTGTLLSGTGLDQLVGLDLANTTSATYNVLTFGFISNGTVDSYSATVVPLPATVWLLGAAVGLLAWRRSRST